MASLTLVTPGASRSAMDFVERGSQVVIEAHDQFEVLDRTGNHRCARVADLVPDVGDVYDPAVRAQTGDVLRRLCDALGAAKWRYADIPLWNLVQPAFHWRLLDSLFQAADVATRLIEVLNPGRVVLTDFNSHLARALAAVAQTRKVPIEVIEQRRCGRGLAIRAQAIPYVAHARDCLKSMVDWQSSCSGHRPVILLNHALRNYEVVEPALREVGRRLSPERLLVVQTGPNGRHQVKADGFACRTFEHYASAVEGLRALRRIAPTVRFLTGGAWKTGVRAAKIAWSGVPLDVLAETEISFGLSRLLGDTVRELVSARGLLRREEPALIVTTEDRSSYTRATAHAARAVGIPSLMVQWGPIAPNAAWLASVATDVASAEGEAAADVLRACEKGADLRIVITGQPKYDRLRAEAATASRHDIRASYGLDSDRPLVLYAAHPIREASAPTRVSAAEERSLEAETAAVIRAVRDMRLVQLVVKPHPNEASDACKRCVALSKSADIHLITKDESVYPLLFACDVVVTHRSAVGLEGVLLHKPLIIVNFSGRPDPFAYVRDGVAVGAYDPSQVEPALRAVLFDTATKALIDKRRPAFLRRHLAPGDVPATERMAELMCSLAVATRGRVGSAS